MVLRTIANRKTDIQKGEGETIGPPIQNRGSIKVFGNKYSIYHISPCLSKDSMGFIASIEVNTTSFPSAASLTQKKSC